MRKIYLDHYNTVDSVMWVHRDYTVQINPCGGQEDRYLIYEPGGDPAQLYARTLQIAKEIIDEEVMTTEDD